MYRFHRMFLVFMCTPFPGEHGTSSSLVLGFCAYMHLPASFECVWGKAKWRLLKLPPGSGSALILADLSLE